MALSLPRQVQDPAVLRVQLREQHLYYQDELLPISRVIPHPNYYIAQNGADIALLELGDPVNISSHVHPVTLPPASETFRPGTQCWVTGWGNLNSGRECQGPLEGDLGTSRLHHLGFPLGNRVPAGRLRAVIPHSPDAASFLSSHPQNPCHRHFP